MDGWMGVQPVKLKGNYKRGEKINVDKWIHGWEIEGGIGGWMN